MTSKKADAQCYAPFLPLDCYVGLDSNLEETYRQANERHISNLGWDQFNERNFEKQLKTIKSEKYNHALDSIFALSKQYIIEKIGEKNFCDRIEFNHQRFRYFTRYIPKTISGELTFKFHYHPISCWTGNGIELKLKFKELESGMLKLEYPSFFPKCSEKECDFNTLYASEIGAKALELGLIDGSENLDIDKFDTYTIALEKMEIPFQKKSFLFDIKSGQYLKDTIQVLNTGYFPISNKEKPFEELVNKSEAIIDATCIGTEEFRGTNGYLYTNYFFQPHHTFKGKKSDKVFAIANLGGEGESWSHGINMPRPSIRCIFFLKKLTPEFFSIIEENVDTLLTPQWGLQINPNQFLFNQKLKMYNDVFPLLKKLSMSNFYAYNNVNCTLDETKDWLKEQGKLGFAKKQGLETWMFNFYWNNTLDAVNGNIVVRSTKDYTFLQEKEFVFEYDTTYVQAFGIRNGSIDVSRFKGNPSERKDKLPKASLTKNYEIISKDLSANRFMVKIKAKNVDNLTQLYPRVSSGSMYAKILFNLNFKIKENIVQDTFELSQIAEPFNNTGKYYDPIAEESNEFAFQRVLTPNVKTSLTNANPVIEKVFPENFSIGDTISILGKNLTNFKDKVHCPCSVVDKEIEFRRHCLVPTDDIIFSSYSKLQFVVPRDFDFNKDGLTKLFPSSGTIKVKYEQSLKSIIFN